MISGDFLSGKWEAPGREDYLGESGFHPAGMSALHQGQEKGKQREVNPGQWHIWSQWTEKEELEMLNQREQIRRGCWECSYRQQWGRMEGCPSCSHLDFFPSPFIFFFFSMECLCACGFVCTAKSALHWPHPGCCSRSITSTGRQGAGCSTRDVTLPSWEECAMQGLWKAGHGSILQAPPAQAELKSLGWAQLQGWTCQFGGVHLGGMGRIGLFRHRVKAAVGKTRMILLPRMVVGVQNLCRNQAGTRGW